MGVIKWWSGGRGGLWSLLEPPKVQFSRGEQGQEQTARRRPLHTSALITQTRLNKRRESGVHPSHLICCYLPESANLPTVECVSAHSFTEQILVGKQTHPIHSCRSLPSCLSVCNRLPQLLPGRRAERWNKGRKNREVSHQRRLSSLIAQILLLVWQKRTAPFIIYSQHLFPCNTFVHAFIILYYHTFFSLFTLHISELLFAKEK